MQNTKIQWTDHTFNPWMGCTKVSPGCTNCYAEALSKRCGRGEYKKGVPRQLTSESYWKQPLKWNNQRPIWEDLEGKYQRRPRVFCASLADWLDDEVPIEWLVRLVNLIQDTPDLDWLLLTKRPQNWRVRIEGVVDAITGISRYTPPLKSWLAGYPPANVWIGTTVEDQKRADERIPELLKIPALIRFLSVEPMLERVHLSLEGAYADIHWAIFGGESGPGARPCNIDWIRDGVKQCRAAGVAPFVKQLGKHVVQPLGSKNPHMADVKFRFQFKDKKGGDPSEWPEDLRVREFPTSAPSVSQTSVNSV